MTHIGARNFRYRTKHERRYQAARPNANQGIALLKRFGEKARPVIEALEAGGARRVLGIVRVRNHRASSAQGLHGRPLCAHCAGADEGAAAGKIPREEFMEPVGLSAYALAKTLGVPLPRVNDIVRISPHPHGAKAACNPSEVRVLAYRWNDTAILPTHVD